MKRIVENLVNLEKLWRVFLCADTDNFDNFTFDYLYSVKVSFSKESSRGITSIEWLTQVQGMKRETIADEKHFDW